MGEDLYLAQPWNQGTFPGFVREEAVFAANSSVEKEMNRLEKSETVHADRRQDLQISRRYLYDEGLWLISIFHQRQVADSRGNTVYEFVRLAIVHLVYKDRCTGR